MVKKLYWHAKVMDKNLILTCSYSLWKRFSEKSGTMTARRSGRAALSKLATSDIDVDSSSGPNSPSIDGSFDDLSLEGRKGKKGALRNLKAKTDETSLFMSDFDPTKGRKARAKVKDTAYKDSHVGIVGNKNRSVKKDCLYDAKGALLWVSTLQIIYWCHYYYYYSIALFVVFVEWSRSL